MPTWKNDLHGCQDFLDQLKAGFKQIDDQDSSDASTECIDDAYPEDDEWYIA